MANVAINGLGRIGRAALKIITDTDGLDVVAVNDIVPADNLAYLLRYDTVYGRYHRQVVADGRVLTLDEDGAAARLRAAQLRMERLAPLRDYRRRQADEIAALSLPVLDG